MITSEVDFWFGKMAQQKQISDWNAKWNAIQQKELGESWGELDIADDWMLFK